MRFQGVSGRRMGSVEGCNDPSAGAAGAGSVWVANSDDGTVTRIDPASNQVTAAIPIGNRPYAVTAGHGAVWVSVG